MELPPDHSRLFGDMDARDCGVAFTPTSNHRRTQLFYNTFFSFYLFKIFVFILYTTPIPPSSPYPLFPPSPSYPLPLLRVGKVSLKESTKSDIPR